MIESLLLGLQMLVQPMTLLALLAGVLIGGVVGFIPGMSGVVGVALLLPFTFHLGPELALPLIIGLLAVTTTADTVPCVLINTPGTAGSQASIVDGYPMAQKGQAGKALGAAFFSSAVGGVIGAFLLSASIPFFRPLVLSFGTAEFLAMTILGLTMVAVLTGRHFLQGVTCAGLGLLTGMVGLDPVNSLNRWTFGTDYLLDGTSLVAVALGLFAIPELTELLSKGATIANNQNAKVEGKAAGVKEALKNKRLIGLSSLVGAWVGFLPGMGTVVANWMAYSLAVALAKDKSQFGKGDIRGLIAPEAANNAALGGALLPTLAFGIPGSAVTALILAGLWIQGVTPGQAMLTSKLHLIFLIIWCLALANIVGAVLAYTFTNQIAKLTRVKIEVFAPIVMVIIFAGVIIENNHIGDVLVVLLFGVVGCVMKRLRWPRPAFILGYILLPVFEQNFFQSTMIYGASWLTRPIVMAILGLVIIGLVFGYRLSRQTGQAMSQSEVKV
ncbi:tripartite tricarboxylate transporter permease [Hirschia baltica]|uniref:DUF112 domain-containing protein n=1 Tax=Hirschia baltica (strain ATCC 49814 / DSM 5838 / IFAM 1418) TaxID=582402 RepID=C6XPK5_HIRBI|nr:tripartite tricarboxylate transporter permease [Hirschia baltica]ACT60270.1 protein of unknown function DUF112 transmembrane [Hirschia baltica ATCC 49814]